MIFTAAIAWAIIGSNDVLTILLAVIAAVGSVTVQGYFARPKTKAEAKASDAAGEVSQSAEARQWVAEFRADAQAARAQAAAAEERAHKAEEAAEDAELRCDDLERKFLKLANYTRSLQAWAMVVGPGPDGPSPPEVPAELVPPLDPHP